MVNRGNEGGMIRLDPEPGVPNVPPRVAEQSISPEPQEAPAAPEAGDTDELKSLADEVSGEGKEAIDEKFMEEYKDLELMQLVTDGYVTHTKEIWEGFSVTFRTITESEDQEIVKYLQGMDGSAWMVGDEVARKTLSVAIMRINNTQWGEDAEERYERIGQWGKPVKLAVWHEWRMLNKAVSVKITGHSGNWLERLLIGRDWTSDQQAWT